MAQRIRLSVPSAVSIVRAPVVASMKIGWMGTRYAFAVATLPARLAASAWMSLATQAADEAVENAASALTFAERGWAEFDRDLALLLQREPARAPEPVPVG